MVLNCIFKDNSAFYLGGAMNCYSGGAPVVRRSAGGADREAVRAAVSAAGHHGAAAADRIAGRPGWPARRLDGRRRRIWA